jgi:hypothetical protein
MARLEAPLLNVNRFPTLLNIIVHFRFDFRPKAAVGSANPSDRSRKPSGPGFIPCSVIGIPCRGNESARLFSDQFQKERVERVGKSPDAPCPNVLRVRASCLQG